MNPLKMTILITFGPFQMLRMAEFTFNSWEHVEIDVVLGTRELPPMQSRSLTWNLNRISDEAIIFSVFDL